MRFRKASLLVKTVILALLVCATVTLVHLQKQINEVNRDIETKIEKKADIKQENEKLAADDEDLQSYVKERDSKKDAAGEDADMAEIVGSIDNSAMEELARDQNYVDPDEIVYEDVNN